MTTQSLRGLAGLEPFHWRGDRQNFQHFNQAFVGLLGRASELSGAEIDAFTEFIMTVNYPPNPFRNLDNTMPATVTIPSKSGGGATTTGSPLTGQSTYVNTAVDAGFSCNSCHLLPTGTTTNLIGSMGLLSQDLKIPHLRNMYEKMGFNPVRLGIGGGNPANIGLSAQKSGFGYLHDGAMSLLEFLALPAFSMNDTQERNILAFLMTFPTESVPAIGAQVTVTASTKNDSALAAAINTLIAQAEAGNCDVIAKGVIGSVAKGFVYDTAANTLTPDTVNETAPSESSLRASLAGSDVLTYSGVPFGAGRRMGIDRDRDGWLDRGEEAIGSDPANPNSNPWGWN